MQKERVDLLSFKSKLKLVLKENANDYWECLKKFTQAKLTKKELDTYARSVLVSEENVALHNLFIKSIFNNANCSHGPPLPPTQTTNNPSMVDVNSISAANKRRTNTNRDRDPKRRRINQEELQRENERRRDRPDTTVYGNRSEISALSQSQARVTSPELLALRKKLHRIASEKGINHVSNETVTAMMSAAELFLKRIFSFTQVEPKPFDSTRTIHPQEFIDSLNSDLIVTAEDMHHLVVTRPYLLGEDLSVNFLEKVSMLL